MHAQLMSSSALRSVVKVGGWVGGRVGRLGSVWERERDRQVEKECVCMHAQLMPSCALRSMRVLSGGG